MFLIFDTETTGFAHYKKPPGDPAQPHMIQFAAALFDPAENRVVRAAKYLIRTVDCSPVPDGAANVHGITTEILRRDGLPPRGVYDMSLQPLFARVQRVVAFNVKFDSLVLRAFCAKLGQPDLLAGKSIHCAMLEMKDILKIPGKFGDYKFPSLAEAYAHVTGGEEIENAHDAMADVRATVVVYSWLTQFYGHAQGVQPFRRPELTATFDTAINPNSAGPASPARLEYKPEPAAASPAAILAAPAASAELPAMYVRRSTDLIMIVPPHPDRAANFPVAAPGPAPQNPELPAESGSARIMTKADCDWLAYGNTPPPHLVQAKILGAPAAQLNLPL